MVNQIKKYILLSVATGLTACGGGRSLTLTSGYKGEVVKLDFGTDGRIKQEKVGELPQTVDLEQYDGQAIKVKFETDGSEQVWLITDLLGEETTLNLIPTSLSGNEGEDGSPVSKILTPRDVNSIMRVILRSYQALFENKFDLAISLSDQALQRASGLSAPHIVKGLALLQKGDKEKALVEFNLAKTSDPEDADLDKMIESLKK